MSFTRTGDFFPVRKGRHSLSNPILSPVAVTLLYNDARSQTRLTKAVTVAIRLTGTLMEELEWVPQSYVEVLEGTGANAGKVLLRQADDPIQGYKLSYASHASGMLGPDHRLRTSGLYPACTTKIGIGGLEHHVIDTEGVKIRGATAKHRVYNRELLVDMPTWFKPTRDNVHRVQRVIEHDEPARAKRKYNRRSDLGDAV